MSCKSIKNLLPLYDDAELGAKERDTVRLHLAACEDCADDLQRIRRARHGMATLRSVAVPEDGVRRTLQALRNREGYRTLRLRVLLQKPAFTWGGVATGFLAVLLVLLLPGVRGLQEPQAPSPVPMTTMVAEEGAVPFSVMEMGTMMRFNAAPELVIEVLTTDVASFFEELNNQLLREAYPEAPIIVDQAENEMVIQLNAVGSETLERILTDLQTTSSDLITYEIVDGSLRQEPDQFEWVNALLKVRVRRSAE